MATSEYYIGVDVGTGSARALLVRKDGQIIASATRETKTWRDTQDHRIFEQSTADIWSCIASCIKDCLSKSGVDPSAVKGLGFDATCSLAVVDFEGKPIQVTKGGELGKEGERNIILWADHRAEEQAEVINKSGETVLDYVGGTMSLEMEIPKILWLKSHMPSSLFSNCQFFDLPDYLTYKATSSITRSACSLTCKCSYVPSSGWQASFFNKIGLSELVDGEYKQIGAEDASKLLTAGMPIGRGLSKEAADELGLKEGTPVGSGLIDAYAGWLGTVAARYKESGAESGVPELEESKHRLAAVAGTSTCHLVQNPKGIFVKGVWGPYRDAAFPGWWMNEGGQSSTGQLIDFTLTTHPAYAELVQVGKEKQTNIHVVLGDLLEQLRVERKAETLVELTRDLHIYPDLHGNRSPLADSRMTGSISGLTLSSSLTDLALKYHATLLAIALQTKHILSTLNASGHEIHTIMMSGSQVKNKILMQLFADTCNVDVVLPGDESGGTSVVLGAAMLGRVAAEASDAAKEGKGKVEGEQQADLLWNIMVDMTPVGTIMRPAASPKEKKLLEAKYKIFLETIEIQRRWRKEMEDALNN